MALSDEMRQLSRHLLQAHDDRMAAVAGIRTATAGQMAEMHTANRQMASELRAHLDVQESELQAQAVEQRHQLAGDRAHLAVGTAAFMGETHAANRQMAAELRAQLDAQESERQAQAVEQRHQLAEDRAHRASDTAAFMDETYTANRQMAADVAAMRGELQTELSEAREVWRNFSGLMQHRRARKPTAAPSPPPVEKAAPPPVVKASAPSSPPVEKAAPPSVVKAAPQAEVKEVTPDDLTVIRGIGPGTQQRLNAARIYTFAHLAGSTAEELKQILGDAGRLAKVEEWITQARELIGLA